MAFSPQKHEWQGHKSKSNDKNTFTVKITKYMYMCIKLSYSFNSKASALCSANLKLYYLAFQAELSELNTDYYIYLWGILKNIVTILVQTSQRLGPRCANVEQRYP